MLEDVGMKPSFRVEALESFQAETADEDQRATKVDDANAKWRSVHA